MTSIVSKARKLLSPKNTLVAALAVSTLGLAAAPANAGGWHGHHRHHGFGYGAAALGGGLLLGAIIADSNRGRYYARDCWIEKRKRYDAYGDRYYVRVRVCD